ncbi:MAG: cation:proton antiporter [Planctomycetota bacterium]
MRRAIALGLVVLCMGGALFGIGDEVVFEEARPTLSFGFLLLAAYLGGDLLSRLKLPKITGYILVGILFGPHVLDFVREETVADLKLIDDLALTFIALAAGGELRLASLRARRRSILFTVLFLTTLVFAGVMTFTVVARPLFPFLEGQSFIVVLAAGALLGTFAVARSPSSAIAIISECRARGPFTEMVLGVTVLMDVLVIMVFAAVVSVCQALVSPGGDLDFFFLVMVFVEIAGSVVAGGLLGFFVALYITKVGVDLAPFILAVGFLVTFVSRQFAHFLETTWGLTFHLEPMLICLTAGFFVTNFSRAGTPFMERIERSSLPIYVVFFSLVGAALDITTLEETWVVALLIVAVRGSLIWAGAWTGGRIAGDPRVFRTTSGLSFLTQAGVSLGLAGIVANRFPEWGPALATTIVAVITVNQVIGPVAFKLALTKTGEAGAGRSANGPEE